MTLVEHPIKDDVWVKSTCNICFGMCAIRVHRVDGIVTEIEGNPDCPTTRGGICPRGATGIMMLYDPNRVNVPLKRTNPEKGIGVDPKWVEISWDEALDTITDRLRKLRADNPKKLLVISSTFLGDHLTLTQCFGAAFGTPNALASGAGTHCGGGTHLFSGLMQSAWTKVPDPNYINYYLNFGCPSGFGAYYSATGMAQRMADARRRGMKHVVIEPWMGMPGMNCDEWIPIRPGTDAALALAMANLLLNEYGMYDVQSIKQYTNGPYLVGADGYYVRDKETGKPLMWDPVDGKPRTYDDPAIGDVALEGSYSVNGATATPAFALVKAKVREYTPEMASWITTVPAATIRRLAREFGEAARIGSTIVIEGKELPYRPVAVGYFRGAAAHRHRALACMAISLLQEIVGANNVPGAGLGMNSRSLGYPETHQPNFGPCDGPDGLLSMGAWGHVAHGFWPARQPKKPETVSMHDLVPTGGASHLIPWGILERDKYKVPYQTEFIIQTGGNFMMSLADPAVMEKAFQEVFNVAFSLYLDESAEFADIVLPDACYLERLDIQADRVHSFSPVDEWAYHLRQPVVEPMFQRRPAQKVILELAERLGLLGDTYRYINRNFSFKEPYTLDPARKYSWEEIVDLSLKGNFGPAHGLEWFRENGLIRWPKKVEEVYWRPFVKTRTPIYFEYFKGLAQQIEKIKKEQGIPGFDTSDFQPLPDWKPCASHEEKRPDFDLYAVYYRLPVHTFTFTYNNPWLDEVSRNDPHTHNVAINTETARKKGIKSGDLVIIESAGTGHKIEARASLTEAIHPEVIAYASGGGHWARNLPIATQPGKGVCPEWLLPVSWDHTDTVTLALDLCVKVKVSKKV